MSTINTITTDQVFERHDKVVAAVDLPHVPAGTRGRVMYVAGVTWIRYHVLFDNGRGLSSVDATQLMTVDAWEKKEYEEEQAARKAARAAAIQDRQTSGGQQSEGG
jgi:hypothetical protein